MKKVLRVGGLAFLISLISDVKLLLNFLTEHGMSICSTNREEIYNMTGYPIMEPPFLSFPIEEMKKKQVEQHFNWYMTQIEGRIKQLNEFINLEKKDVVLDKTPESR